jgi:MoaA/NifB/PqqE/SkfB family radical SAM enzyme
MLAYADIRRVHLEMTTKCNAACPMCSRNERGGFKIADLPETELSLDDIRKILPPAFVAQLSQIWFCGNYGDPIIARDTREVMAYFKHSNPQLRIGMNTNGSARKPEWWRSLAGLVDYCHFAIDGLADTNHLYRRRTHWDVLMANAQAFIEAGGMAHWEYIVFRHNEHQVQEARELARAMGFKRFRVRKTGRFFFGGSLQPSLTVTDSHGRPLYDLEPPANIELINTASAELGTLADRPTGYRDYLDTTAITCKAQVQNEIYVSGEGLVFPCCYLASFYRGSGRKKDAQFAKMLDQLGGRKQIDGRHRALADIVGDAVFQSAIPDSWNRPSVAEGRLATCSSTCGSRSPTKGQYTPSLI